MKKSYTKEYITKIRRRFGSRLNLKSSIFKRDNWTCRLCKVVAEEIDHIKPLNQYPELAYEPTNLRALCMKCNRTRKRKWLNISKM